LDILKKIAERPRIIFGSAIRRQIDFYRVKPKVATIFLTFRCNSRCTTCTFWTRDKEAEKPKELSLEGWKKVAEALYENGITSVEIFGGNVLLRKEVLVPLIYHMKSLGMELHIPTNQIGLDPKTIEAIVDAGVDVLYISTDGVQEYQDKIRGFDGAINLNKKIIKSIRECREKLKKDKPELVCNTTISKFNVDILDQIPEYAIEMGFDSVHFEYAGEMDDQMISASLIDGLKPTPMFIQQNNQSILVSQQQAKILKRKLKEIKRKYRHAPIYIRTINTDIFSEKNLYEGTIPHKKCYVERIESTVDPYGNLVACPVIHNNQYGNLLEEDFKSIWNNSRHKRLRKLQNCGKLPMCHNCIYGAQRNPSFRLSLKRNFLVYAYDPLLKLMSRNGKYNGCHKPESTKNVAEEPITTEN